MVLGGRVLCPALSFSVSFIMIRLLPKIMMLASSAVLSSTPVVPIGIEELPDGYYASQSASCELGISGGYAVDLDIGPGIWQYDNVFLGFHGADDLGVFVVLPIKRSVQWNGYAYFLTDFVDFDRAVGIDYPVMDSYFPDISYRELLSLFSYFISSGVGSREIGLCNWIGEGSIGMYTRMDYSIDPFVYEGTYTADLSAIGGGEVTVPLISSMGGCLVAGYSEPASLDNQALLLDFYEADYSESASDLFGVVTDAIGEMGSGLADGVEEATSLFYADGSFTTLGILTLLTCGVALVFSAFYLIRKYLHVGVK